MAFGRIAVYADDNRHGPSEIDAPGHTNMDLGASWTPNRRIEIRGQLRNLLNRITTPVPIRALCPPRASTGR